MSKTFRPWKIDEPLLLPPVVQEFVAKDHLARLVLNLVREDIDLAAISGSYAGERGQPPFDPVMMTVLLLYSYCCGIYSSRRIAKACRERVDFMSIVGFDAPDFRTISDSVVLKGILGRKYEALIYARTLVMSTRKAF